MTTAMSQIHDNSDSAPGASAQREYARRQQARRQRVRARYGPVGSLVAALAVQTRARDLLGPLLALPLFVPIVIGAVQSKWQPLLIQVPSPIVRSARISSVPSGV